MADDRKRPEDFLELVERAKRGRLKVYIGSAAGVGKTYQMLGGGPCPKKARGRCRAGVYRNRTTGSIPRR